MYVLPFGINANVVINFINTDYLEEKMNLDGKN